MRPGDIIAGKYELERKLGQGGVGVVWAAKQLGLGRAVAVKLLRGDHQQSDLERAAREARAVGQLKHDNCVQLFDFGRTDAGKPFLVFELLQGQSLDALRGARLEWRRAVEVIAQVAAATRYAHANGVVHRDIKPGNIFQAQHRGRELIKVLDFGLAKLGGRSPELTKSGAILGTMVYMSPEQLRDAKDVTPATDLYSIGVVLFELLEGRPPFTGDSAFEVAQGHLTKPAPPLQRANCPDALHKLVARLLAKDPNVRPTAAELCDALESLEKPPRASDPLPTGLLAGAGALMLTLAGIGLTLILSADPPPETPPAPSKATVDVPPTVAAPSAAAPAAEPPASEPPTPATTEPVSGCGEPQSTGVRHIRRPLTQYTIVVPKNYDPEVATPLVMFLPEAGQIPLKDTRFAPFVDDESFLLLIPVALAGDGRAAINQWASSSDHENVVEALHDVRTRYCVDEDREFAIGHATGGEIAETLGCAGLGIEAIATTATRTPRVEKICAIPYLHLAATADGYNPIDGGSSCSGAPKISFAEQQDIWRKLNGCADKRTELSSSQNGTCWDWSGCERPFRTCLVDGGHNWPFTGPRTVARLEQALMNTKNCDGPPNTFGFRRAIWDFFQSLNE